MIFTSLKLKLVSLSKLTFKVCLATSLSSTFKIISTLPEALNDKILPVKLSLLSETL